MNKMLARHERATVFLAVAATWSFSYLAVNRWNAGRAATVLAWDPVWAFPFSPVFVIPYLSAFALPFFAAAGLRDREAFRRFALMAAVVMLASAAVFVLWPLTIPRPPAGEGAVARLLTWLYAADRPANLFPSLHVSLSFLFAKAAAVARPHRRALFLAWAALIAASTLFIRQHYFIDVVGGLIVAQVAWAAYPPIRKRS